MTIFRLSKVENYVSIIQFDIIGYFPIGKKGGMCIRVYSNRVKLIYIACLKFLNLK